MAQKLLLGLMIIQPRSGIWQMAHGLLIYLVLHGHTHGINSVAISPDGSKVVTGSYDQTAKIWNMADGSWIADLSGPHGHTREINSVAISPDGSKVVTGSRDIQPSLEYGRWLMDC